MGSILGNLAAILTATGISIYVLGLVGLAIPLRNITNDLSTAWYITSLLPRIVVAGQGVRIWLQLPLIMTISITLVVVAPKLVYPSATFPPFWAATIASALLSVYAVFSSPRGEEFRKKGYFRIAGVVFGGGIMGIAVAGLANQMSLSGSFPWIMLAFVAAFIAGLPTAITADPPLPNVTIIKQVKGAPEGVGESLEGKLVAHSDGFWHLFDENDILLSIPDDKVLQVQMGEMGELK